MNKVRNGLNIWWMRLSAFWKMALTAAVMASTLVALGGTISVQAGLPALTTAHSDSIIAHSRRMDAIEARQVADRDSLMAALRDVISEQSRTNCFLEAFVNNRRTPPRCLK